jgi:UrcA family protein
MNKVPGLNVKRAAVASVAAVVAIFAATMASAETSESPSVTVRYGDLDLATARGAHMLYRRIAVAAEQVCPTAHTRDLALLARARSCQADAVSRAVREVNSPQLAAVYARREGHG